MKPGARLWARSHHVRSVALTRPPCCEEARAQSCPDLQAPPAVGTMLGKHEGRCLQMNVRCLVMLNCRLRPQPSQGRGKPASCALSKFQTHRTVSIGRSLYAVTFGGSWLFSDGTWNRWPRRAFRKPGQSTLRSFFPFVNATRSQEATGSLGELPLALSSS